VALASELGRRCPSAWVLNLANPLSVTTAAMIQAGAPRKCVGLCELPFTTVAETCRILGVPLDAVEWRYAGFNHRGFVFELTLEDQDLLAQLPELLGRRTVFGVTAKDIARVGAIPLKYFRLCDPSPEATAAHRAEFLLSLKQTISDELKVSHQPPPSLSKRDFRWYESAVVPMIVAIFAGDGRELIVNQTGDDGLVWELPARVFRDGLQPVAAAPSGRVAEWLARFAAHERALLEAVASPSLSRIEQALALDPCVPEARVHQIASAVHSRLQTN
jgi:6-phospho-beta-glucosidase